MTRPRGPSRFVGPAVLTVLGVVAVLLAVVSGLTGGAGGGAGTVATPLASPTTVADCTAVISADVVRGLGWTTTAAPTYDLGTCTLASPNGTITVQRVPVAEREARCGALRPDPHIV